MPIFNSRWIGGIGIVLGMAAIAQPSGAQLPRVAPRPAGVNGVVNLPYTSADSAGNQWMIYPQGWFRQQGGTPLFSQAGMLMVNGNNTTVQNNQARLDEKTGEVVFENMTANGLSVTRRVLIDKQNNFVRYIDILKNPSPQDMSVNIQFSTNFNYGTQASQPITDPRNKERQIGCAVLLQPGRAIYELYATRGAKIVPAIMVPQGNNTIQATQQYSIPAGKQVAIFHLHGIATSTDVAVQTATGFKDAQLFSNVPLELRKTLINTGATQSIGDREVLRGDLFDVLELRSGDQIKGTIAEKTFKLQTFYGTIELPADRVVGLINVGQFRPRQLLVTIDGEVFGGMLEKQTLEMQLSSGQSTQVPVGQVSRFGYRKRSGEPDEWTFDKPMVALRSGERMLVAMPAAPFEIMTQYGLLKLKADAISSINFQPEDHGVHEIELTDGSKFSGLAMAEHFDLQLVGTATQQNVTFPAATVGKLLINKLPENAPVEPSPTLQLTNDDQLSGAIAGELKLDTNFDTITINGSELLSLTHAAEAGLDVQVTLWDQTTLSGQLRESQVTCSLKSGVTVTVPIALISKYDNPLPRPSQIMVDRIKSVVGELSAEDWRQRERAEAQLVTMGTSVLPVLKDLRDAQPLEAQQRIDSVFKQLDKKSASAAPNVIPE